MYSLESLGSRINYDILLIATGAVKDYDSIMGFRNNGFSICDDFQAERLAKRLESFEGGKIVIGSARTEWDRESTTIKLDAPCEGPIGEVMFLVFPFNPQGPHTCFAFCISDGQY